jgi:hypothetical protein
MFEVLNDKPISFHRRGACYEKDTQRYERVMDGISAGDKKGLWMASVLGI